MNILDLVDANGKVDEQTLVNVLRDIVYPDKTNPAYGAHFDQILGICGLIGSIEGEIEFLNSKNRGSAKQ